MELYRVPGEGELRELRSEGRYVTESAFSRMMESALRFERTREGRRLLGFLDRLGRDIKGLGERAEGRLYEKFYRKHFRNVPRELSELVETYFEEELRNARSPLIERPFDISLISELVMVKRVWGEIDGYGYTSSRVFARNYAEEMERREVVVVYGVPVMKDLDVEVDGNGVKYEGVPITRWAVPFYIWDKYLEMEMYNRENEHALMCDLDREMYWDFEIVDVESL